MWPCPFESFFSGLQRFSSFGPDGTEHNPSIWIHSSCHRVFSQVRFFPSPQLGVEFDSDPPWALILSWHPQLSAASSASRTTVFARGRAPLRAMSLNFSFFFLSTRINLSFGSSFSVSQLLCHSVHQTVTDSCILQGYVNLFSFLQNCAGPDLCRLALIQHYSILCQFIRPQIVPEGVVF